MNISKTIKIKGLEFTMKSSSYRAMFQFEEMLGKSVSEIKTLKDQIIFVYCILDTSNKDFPYSLEDFIDLLEEYDSILIEFSKLTEQLKKK